MFLGTDEIHLSMPMDGGLERIAKYLATPVYKQMLCHGYGDWTPRLNSDSTRWDLWTTVHSDGIIDAGTKHSKVTVDPKYFNIHVWFDTVLRVTDRQQDRKSITSLGTFVLLNQNNMIQSDSIYYESTDLNCAKEKHFLYFESENPDDYLILKAHIPRFDFPSHFLPSSWQKVFILSSTKPLYQIWVWMNSRELTIQNIGNNIKGRLFYHYADQSWTRRNIVDAFKKSGYSICFERIYASWKCLDEDFESWNKASERCKSHGETLPIIRSREEQDNLIQMISELKSLLIFLPPPLIFIGLTGNQVRTKIQCT